MYQLHEAILKDLLLMHFFFLCADSNQNFRFWAPASSGHGEQFHTARNCYC